MTDQRPPGSPVYGPVADWAAPIGRPSLPTTIEALRPQLPTDRLTGWIVTIAITALAFAIRLPHLGRPKNLVFDETYYPKDAWSLLRYGYEANYVDNANTKIAAGDLTNLWQNGAPSYVVHPPLGKWLIASGEWVFGMNSFGWRFPSLVFGTLMVAVVIRLARRLGRSTLVGGIAGLLLTFDGLAFVMSRIGLLDVFQAFFLVAAVACVAADRDWFRTRLANWLQAKGMPDLGGRFGPIIWWRPWRLLAGVMFGCALSVKWNSMFAMAAMGVLSVIFDLFTRRQAGAGRKTWIGLAADAIPAFCYLIVLTIPIYLATWIGWFQTSGGWDRQWGAKNQDSFLVRTFGTALGSLLHYTHEVYNFHTGDYMKQQTHTYNAHPAGWLVMQRTIGIDAVNGIKPGEQGCTAAAGDTCLRVISGMGTPLLWWMAAAALIVGLYYWIARGDWRFGVPILALLSTYIPWFFSADRPVFFFYAICIIPFSCIVLALCLGKLLGPADGPERRGRGWLVASLITLIGLNFAFIYPILTDQLLTRKQWLWRMWFKSWI